MGVRHVAVKDFPPPGAYRLVVLPLTNHTSDPGAGDLLEGALTAELAAIDVFEVVDPVAARTALSRNRIRYADRMNTEQFRSLGAELEADGVFVGAVHAYEYRQDEDGTVPMVTVHVRIIDLGTGRIQWIAERTKVGTDGELVLGIGRERSLTRLAEKVARDIIATLR